MRRMLPTFAIAALALLATATPAGAEFGLSEFELAFSGPHGEAATAAGSHPFAMTTSLALNTKIGPGGQVPDGELEDLRIELPVGFAGDPNAVTPCPVAEFLTPNVSEEIFTSCPDAAAVGVTAVNALSPTSVYRVPVYNLVPSPGEVAKLGFVVVSTPVTIDIGVSETPPYNVVVSALDAPQTVFFFGSQLTVWGDPADPAHDPLRGGCLKVIGPEYESLGDCPTALPLRSFTIAPRSCSGPLLTAYEARSWQGGEDVGGTETPPGMSSCARLGFSPSIGAQPTAKGASSPTGLDFALDTHNEESLLNTNEGAVADADIEKVVVTLPEGMSANPSIAEGLEACTMEDLQRETAFSEPGEGCPNASKIGSIEVETPLLDEKVNGALFIAKPYENYAENSLLAMYLVIKNANLGIKIAQPLRVEPDPVTGRLTTVAEDLPQLPYSHFKLHFREGARSPLTTPQGCGTYDVEALLYPSSGNPPVVSNSAFQVITGPNEGPCPSGGLPPFKPGLIAGTLNNRAGSFSPFYLRLSRSDSEQEITHFSIKLPPGITGKLAGIPYCSDAAITAAKARTGPHGGQEELDSPSCPAASEIGRTLAGAGVGPSLTYAPGKVYLAGPYNGSPLSMVAITAGVVGPFDIGTVVIREAFRINPETAEVFIDSVGSDPIPHIIRGIPVHLRDIRAYVDRPEFVLNPTDCSPTSTASTVLGSGLDFVSEADDNPVTVASRFQAADCAALTFAPQLSFRLIGGTKRGKFPRLVSHLQMNGIGEAGIDHASVTLPRSEFIEQGHFVTICTRVQFKEGAGNGTNCPPGSIYGHARAVTPILSEPLEGPVMLRSNPERSLPDVVAALHNSQVDFDLVGNVDSVKGQLRTTFATAPDAPVTSFDLELDGGAKGLFVNSTNLCAKKYRAAVSFVGQNGKAFSTKPLMQAKCKGKAKKAKHRHRRHARRGRR